MLLKRPRFHDKTHLKFIASLPCVICRRPSQAAHIRYASAKYAAETGMGEKPDDRFVLPLCPDCHLNGPDAQHRQSESAFWDKHNIDPHAMALALYRVTGDTPRAAKILGAWRA